MFIPLVSITYINYIESLLLKILPYKTKLSPSQILRISHIKRENPEMFDNSKECLNDLNDELGIYFMTFNSLAFAAEYFTACFALRDDRDEMNCDDVVKAWLLMLNLFLSDIKPLIF